MMISPGTPRIHRSRGTMLASFLSTATLRAERSQAWGAPPGRGEIRLTELSSAHYTVGLDDRVRLVTAKPARAWGRLRSVDPRKP